LKYQAGRVLEYMSGMIRYNSEAAGRWFESSRARHSLVQKTNQNKDMGEQAGPDCPPPV
jgi:hypothetical protein